MKVISKIRTHYDGNIKHKMFFCIKIDLGAARKDFVGDEANQAYGYHYEVRCRP